MYFISVEDIAVYFVLRITYLGRLTKYAVGSTQYGTCVRRINSFETHLTGRAALCGPCYARLAGGPQSVARPPNSLL